MPSFDRRRARRGAHARSEPPRLTTPSSYTASGPEEFAEELDGLSVIPLDEAPELHPRPDAVGTTYVEHMGAIRAEEQLNHYRALGENLARPFKEEADAHREAAAREARLIDAHQPVVDKAIAKYHLLLDVAGDALVRRHPRERSWYHARMILFLMGDLVGVAGGLIILGEVPVLAIIQAVAAAVAAVTSGLLGGEVKDCRLARQRRRDPDSLPEEHKRHAHLFQGPDDGEYMAKMMVLGSLTIVVLLGIGIFMLRSATEGSDAGAFFGLIAVAVAAGSWVSCYAYTDDLADKVEQAEHQVHRTMAHHQKLMALPARSIVAQADATAGSIEKEYDDLGWAAYRRVMATVYGWHADRPTIFGHGWAPGRSPAGVADVGTRADTDSAVTDIPDTAASPPSSNGHRPLSRQEAP